MQAKVIEIGMRDTIFFSFQVSPNLCACSSGGRGKCTLDDRYLAKKYFNHISSQYYILLMFKYPGGLSQDIFEILNK